MKVALASLAVIGFAAAQDLTGIPTCAVSHLCKYIIVTRLKLSYANQIHSLAALPRSYPAQPARSPMLTASATR